HMINQLKKELQEKEDELYKLKDLLHQSQINSSELNRAELIKSIREEKDEGKLIEFLDRIITNKSHYDDNYKDALLYAARLFMNENKEYRDFIYSKVLDGLKSEEIPEFIIRAGLNEEPIPLK